MPHLWLAAHITRKAGETGRLRLGRYRLTTAHERPLDVLALDGGRAVDPNELEVGLRRGG